MSPIKRLTLVVDEGRIEKVFYPLFPSGENTREVIEWLSHNADEGIK
jgi:peroxiredoxin